jgi:hypothetical protein
MKPSQLWAIAAVLAIAAAPTASATEPLLSANLAYFDGVSWHPLTHTPNLCVSPTAYYQLQITSTRPAYLSIFAIDAFGRSAPVWPWVDADCITCLPIAENKRSFLQLTDRDIETALGRHGLLWDGQYALIILADEGSLPRLTTLTPKQFECGPIHQEVDQPLFFAAHRGVCRTLVANTLNEVARPATSYMLPHYYTSFSHSLLAHYDDAYITSFTMNLDLEPTPDWSHQLSTARHKHKSCWHGLNTNSGTAHLASADAEQQLLRALPLNSFPHGQLDVAQILYLRGYTHALMGTSGLALEYFDRSDEMLKSIEAVSPTVDVCSLRAAVSIARASLLTRLRRSDEALSALELSVQRASDVVSICVDPAAKDDYRSILADAYITRAAVLDSLGSQRPLIDNSLDTAAEHLGLIRHSSYKTYACRMRYCVSRSTLLVMDGDIDGAMIYLDEALTCFQHIAPQAGDGELLSALRAMHTAWDLQMASGRAIEAQKTYAQIAGLIARSREHHIDGLTALYLLDFGSRIEPSLVESQFGQPVGELAAALLRPQLHQLDMRDPELRDELLVAISHVADVDLTLADDLCTRLLAYASHDYATNPHFTTATDLLPIMILAARLDLRHHRYSEATHKVSNALRLYLEGPGSRHNIFHDVSCLIDLCNLCYEVGYDDAASRVYSALTARHPRWYHLWPLRLDQHINRPSARISRHSLQ